LKKNTAKLTRTVLIDTNILVSGLVFTSGNEHKILQLAEDKVITLLLPEVVLKEARTVLSHRFAGYEVLLDIFIQRTQHLIVPISEFEGEIDLHRESVRDPKDIAVLAATIATKPDFIVTGDKTLRQDMQCSREVTAHTVVCSSSELLKAILRRP